MKSLLRDEYPRPMRGLLAGAAGGLLASWVMSQFQTMWSKASEKLQESSDSQQPGKSQQTSEDEDATMKLAGKLSSITQGRELSKDEKKKAGTIIHYAYGTLAGAGYGLLSEYVPAARLGFGSLFGAILFVVGDEIAVPVLGLSQKPAETPPSSHLLALASHFVYGVSTEAVRKGIRRAA